ncbi:MAG TPA: hypothetical protein VFS20_09400 [Longimicrobium sp.]|nr:hypothetical protein [Longimicrobium sp.]
MRHRFPAMLLCIHLCSLAAPQAAAQRQEVFNAMTEYRPSAVSAADQAVVRRDVLPVARQLSANARGCGDELRVIDVVPGSFTAPGAPQRAVLYRYCPIALAAAESGIAIVQAGRVVAHVTIAGITPDGLRAARDVDLDGVWELVVLDTAAGSREVTSHLSVFQAGPGDVRVFGRMRVMHDDTPTGRRKSRVAATVLYATPGRRPRWEAETWHSRETRNHYCDLTALHPVTLGRDRATYRRIR